MKVKFRQVVQYSEICHILKGMKDAALLGDFQFFIEEFARHTGIDPRKISPDTLVKTSDPHVVKLWVAYDGEARPRGSKPTAFITRLELDNIITICVFDAGDFGKTPETVKELCLLCDQYKAIRFHAKDERMALLARYGGYEIEPIETVYLATRPGVK